ncbi:hypothetical protein HYPSUDRAFT_47631 [Hypholoma sublateritium FD-334 SS-4]|uniref:Uncharacterized protein n=1 Tax=Hypholoma sublateritium (strain FD-334 SS-4) TaxID=945553 RepID=A0A0D2P745_HYPSF|nr:hypothetical protein HYPSUDRAFT_47631 [Hypholoma sublateritium FD-334 SS-4]
MVLPCVYHPHRVIFPTLHALLNGGGILLLPNMWEILSRYSHRQQLFRVRAIQKQKDDALLIVCPI